MGENVTDFDLKEALQALRTYLRSLSKTKIEPPLIRPEWAYAEAEAVACYTVRGRICYAFGLVESQGSIKGYVLDTTSNIAYPVRDGNLQNTLCRVGLW